MSEHPVAALKAKVVEWLRVPAEPELPAGAPGSVQVFRAADGYLRYRLSAWMVRQVGVLFGIALILGVTHVPAVAAAVEQIPIRPIKQLLGLAAQFSFFEFIALAAFLVQAPFGFLGVFLDYEYRWYMVTDRSLRIREGVWRVSEQTMTFSNVQNVAVRQGPLERFFGISDVEVRSAGGGGTTPAEQHGGKAENLHMAYFRGVDNAAEIRDLILDHMRKAKASGLGDPDEAEERTAAGDALTAARAVLEEARQLRAAV